MKRGVVLGMLLALGALAAVKAQPPAANAPKVVEVEKVKDNLFVLRDRAAAATRPSSSPPTASPIVDAKNPGWGQPILDKVKELTPKPVTIADQHPYAWRPRQRQRRVPGDGRRRHAGEHEGQHGEDGHLQDEQRPWDGQAHLQGQDDDRQRRRSDRSRTTSVPATRTATRGSSFPAHRIVHSGDIFAGKGLPLVDGNNGGSVLHYSETLMKAYNGIKNVDTIINGHMPTQTTWADLKKFADFNQDFLTWAQAELKAGKTPEQAAPGWKVPEKYNGYSSQVSANFGGMAGRLTVLAQEMKK